MIGNALRQPDAQDPLGLTRAQWEADPRQADPAAMRFDTRKTVNQPQGGVDARAALRRGHRPAGDRLRRHARRAAVPRAARHGADVVRRRHRPRPQLRRGRRPAHVALHARPGARRTLTFGADYETAARAPARLRQQQRRARRPAPRRGRLRQQHRRLPAARVAAARRAVGFRRRALQRRPVPQPTTTTSPRRTRTTAAAAITTTRARCWVSSGTRRTSVNVYANYGQGFETPTFAELAYRPVGPGLNLDLDPAVSRSAEVGLKAFSAGSSGSTSRCSTSRRPTRSSSTPPSADAPPTRTPAARAGAASRSRGKAISAPGSRATPRIRGCRPKFTSEATTGLPPRRRPGRRAPARGPARERLRRAHVVVPAPRGTQCGASRSSTRAGST